MRGFKTKRILGLLFAMVFVLCGIGTIGMNKAEAAAGTASAADQQISKSKETQNKGMNVHFIDVGQADCILVESAGKYMLVDAGNNDDADTILDYLKNRV